MAGPSPQMALIRRELVTSLRSWRAFGVLALLALVAVLPLAYLVQDANDVIRRGGMADFRALVGGFLLLLLAGGCVLIPGLAGAGISGERDRNSLAFLRMTLLTPRGIVTAKLINVLGLFTLLTVGLLPLLGVIFFTVGVGWDELLLQACVVFAAAFAAACAGLLCSAVFQRTVVAVFAGYAAMLLLGGLFWLLPWLIISVLEYYDFGTLLRSGMDEALQTLVRLMPGLTEQEWHAPEETLAMVTMPGVCVVAGVGGLSPVIPLYATLYQLLVGGACFVFARRRLARPDEPEKLRREKPVTGRAELAARRRHFPFYLIDPLREHPPIPDDLNPVMVKELRWGLLGRMTAMVRVFYAAFMVDMVLVTGAAVSARDSIMTVHLGGLLEIAAACLFAPLMLANIFTKEYEQENMDMLRMTLVTPGRVLLGKLAGGVAAFLPLMLPALLVLLLAVALYAEAYPAVMWVMSAVTFLVVAWCALALSLVASLHTRRAGAAFVLSYVLCLVFLLGVYPLAAGAATQMFPWDETAVQRWSGPPQPYHAAQQVAHAFSPLVAYGSLISNAYYNARFSDFVIWLWSMAGFTLFGAAALGYAHRVFRRRYLPG